MIATLPTDLARLNAASPENRALRKNRPKRGTILLKSGVIGLTENRKPTCTTLPASAATKATARTGSVVRAKKLKKAWLTPPSRVMSTSVELCTK